VLKTGSKHVLNEVQFHTIVCVCVTSKHYTHRS